MRNFLNKLGLTPLLVALILPLNSLAKDEVPPNVGNYALPTSQQPGPLVSIGENIINKNQTQVFLFVDKFGEGENYFVDVIPAILYGVTDQFSIFVNTPVAASYKKDQQRSSGLEDFSLQFEYAFYVKSTLQYMEEATVLANTTIPTGSTKKQPPTGFGSPTIFLGATINRMYTDWFGFSSYGVLFTSSNQGTKFGNQFLYQGGFGRNILGIPSKCIVAWMIEVDGIYIEKDRIKGVRDENSGGNTIYVTPSLWFSTPKIVAQLGLGLPASQHLFGHQTRSTYLLLANFGWTF